MTHASLGDPSRHDTLKPVTGRSGRGTARQTIRIDEDLWERFGALAEPDRSTVLRDFIAWYVQDQGAKMPKRPTGSNDLPPGLTSYVDGITNNNPAGRTWYQFRTAQPLDNDAYALIDKCGPGMATDGGDRVFSRSRSGVEKAYRALLAAGYVIEDD